jgi:hypothetical protein
MIRTTAFFTVTNGPDVLTMSAFGRRGSVSRLAQEVQIRERR